MEEKKNGTPCPCCCGGGEDGNGTRHTLRSAEEKKALLNRLHRIAGQLRGIESMIESDSYCNDILIQSAAAGAAIAAFEKEVLASHIHGCVARDIREGKDGVIDELMTTIRKLIR